MNFAGRPVQRSRRSRHWTAECSEKGMKEELEESGLNDITVTDNELGITLTWDSLNFYPNSSELLPGEETKLAQIARILSEIPGRDVLVEGHTALAGTV
jgi:outer membrane protein OmpA-like peptidoglycan-associated protein